jgi:hypothetical protein
MKKRIILIVFVATALISCDQIKDLFSKNIDTTLNLTIPVSVTQTAVALKSVEVVTSYPFTKSGTLSLADNEDVADYTDKIKSVNINSIDASVLGLSSGQVIETLTVSVTGVGTIMTLTNITSTSVITPNISTNLLDQIGSKLESDLAITATVTGSTSSPMTFNLKLALDATIKAGI